LSLHIITAKLDLISETLLAILNQAVIYIISTFFYHYRTADLVRINP